jgi:ATP-dependent 26S proteasome regulatory subunit
VLQALDGISDNAGVFTIATTNYLSRIDDALKDRPGRFSRIITVPVPDTETRRVLLERLAPEFRVDEADLDLGWLTENTQGYTGDWLRNLFVTARLFAISDKRDEINKSDLQAAIHDIEINRDVAVKPTPEMPAPRRTALSSEGGYA